MRKQLVASALAVAIAFGGTAVPVLADGAASARNILITGAAAAIGIINFNHRKRVKQQEQQEQQRRQASYRAYFYHKYGYYPTEQQFRDWYFRTYGVYPT
ncbi:MAG: hypothetical protein ACREM6_08965 [Vulcanimicrobiaceae bacterium]